MTGSHPPDGTPGSFPSILFQDRQVVFTMGVMGIMPGLKLQLRVSPDGQVLCAIIDHTTRTSK